MKFIGVNNSCGLITPPQALPGVCVWGQQVEFQLCLRSDDGGTGCTP